MIILMNNLELAERIFKVYSKIMKSRFLRLQGD